MHMCIIRQAELPPFIAINHLVQTYAHQSTYVVELSLI